MHKSHGPRKKIGVLAVFSALVVALFGSFSMPAAQAADTIWKPTPSQPLSFHWVLGGPLDVNNSRQMGRVGMNGQALPEPDVYDIDGQMNSAATVAYLHSKGKKVICYIDVGVYENYRPDAAAFKAITPKIWGKADGNWEGSYWLDIRRVEELRPIMQARLQMCKDKGFDAVEPDEMDGWENSLDPNTNKPSATKGETGFAITYQDQLTYNRKIAEWAHAIGLSIGQKGDLIQTRDLVSSFDWTLNEECFQYSECTNPYDPILDREFEGLQLYTRANKAVFVAEYKNFSTSQFNKVCTQSRTHHFNTVKFKLGLPNNGGRTPCVTSNSW